MAVALCLTCLVPATAACLYYLTLVAAGSVSSHRRNVSRPPLRIAVVIPAHNEGASLPHTLASVFAADYPPERLRVLVVADNCTDDTAAVAARHGAEVAVRNDSRRGKGYALGFGFERALAERPDAVLVLDADCTIEAGLLRRVSEELTDGEAVQAAVSSRNGGGTGGFVAAVGAEMENATAAGLSRLGWSVPLRGTGMAFRRELLERYPWTSHGLTEDAEFTAVLTRAGVRVRFVPDHQVRCDPPTHLNGLLTQRRRWRAALRVHGLFTRSVTSKPLVLGQLTATAVLMPLVQPTPLMLLWLAAVLLLTAGIYGWATLRVGCPSLGTLARAPLVVVRLAAVAVGGFWRRDSQWERTPRT